MKKDSTKGIHLMLIITALMVMLLALEIYYQGKDDMREANTVATHELEEANLSIMNTMMDIEESVKAVSQLAWTRADSPEAMAAITESLLNTGNQIVASCVSFEPYTFKEYGRLLQVYSHMKDGKVETKLLREDYGNDYLSKEWYRNGLKREDGYWSDPYTDGVDRSSLIVSYVMPIHDSNRRTIGTLNVDITLDWMEHLLEETKPYPNSVCMLQTPKGMLIAGTPIDSLKNKDDHLIISRPVKSGDGTDIMLLTLASQKKDIYRNVTTMFYRMLLVSVIGLILLGIIILRSIRNERSLIKLTHEKGMMEKELNIAHSIQMGILRDDFPQTGADLYATLKPMHEVGGDLYDYQLVTGKEGEKEELYFIIGDVAGKSISAAIIMSATVTLFRLLAQQGRQPAEIIAEINNTLSQQNPSLTFVTALVGCIDLQHGVLNYCNAGHNQPFVTEPDGSARRMMEVIPNIPLGYQENYDFQPQQFQFGKDTMMVLYTDGLNETINTAEERMGLDRVRDIIARNSQATARQMADKLIEGHRAFMGEAEQVDDITVMCIKGPKITSSVAEHK